MKEEMIDYLIKICCLAGYVAHLSQTYEEETDRKK